jgi:hypothetical protein
MVYRGVDLSTGETVAVKISSSFGSQLGERFQQEANCLAAIAHPAIVRYIAHGKTDHGEHYLVMEWLDGETLEDRLGRGSINLGATVRMIRRVAEALAVAHQHGVIHRDIKPANIFLPGKDVSKIKLLDFGIARRLFDPASLRLTQAGSALGTPMYMSPEQAQGSLDVDARADVFSLGCVFFECLTGSPPFMAESTTGTLARITADESIDVDARCLGVPPRLTDLLAPNAGQAARRAAATMADVLAQLGSVTEELKTSGFYAVAPRPRRACWRAALLVATGERRLVSVIVASARTMPADQPKIRPGFDSGSGQPAGAQPLRRGIRRSPSWYPVRGHRGLWRADPASGQRLAGGQHDRRSADHAARPGRAGRALRAQGQAGAARLVAGHQPRPRHQGRRAAHRASGQQRRSPGQQAAPGLDPHQRGNQAAARRPLRNRGRARRPRPPAFRKGPARGPAHRLGPGNPLPRPRSRNPRAGQPVRGLRGRAPGPGGRCSAALRAVASRAWSTSSSSASATAGTASSCSSAAAIPCASTCRWACWPRPCAAPPASAAPNPTTSSASACWPTPPATCHPRARPPRPPFWARSPTFASPTRACPSCRPRGGMRA